MSKGGYIHKRFLPREKTKQEEKTPATNLIIDIYSPRSHAIFSSRPWLLRLLLLLVVQLEFKQRQENEGIEGRMNCNWIEDWDCKRNES